MFKAVAEWICLVVAWMLIQIWPIVGMNFALSCNNFFHCSKKKD